MSAVDAVGVVSGRRDGAVSDIETDVARSQMSDVDTVGVDSRRIDSHVPHGKIDIAFALMCTGDAVGVLSCRVDGDAADDNVQLAVAARVTKSADRVGTRARGRDVSARDLHAQCARLPVMPGENAVLVRGHVGGGVERNVARMFPVFARRYPYRAGIAGAAGFGVARVDPHVVAWTLAVVVHREVPGEPDGEVAAGLVLAARVVAVEYVAPCGIVRGWRTDDLLPRPRRPALVLGPRLPGNAQHGDQRQGDSHRSGALLRPSRPFAGGHRAIAEPGLPDRAYPKTESTALRAPERTRSMHRHASESMRDSDYDRTSASWKVMSDDPILRQMIHNSRYRRQRKMGTKNSILTNRLRHHREIRD